MLRFHDPQDDPQRPFDLAVVTATVLRPSLAGMLESVFAQDHPGRIHVMLGIDKPCEAPIALEQACRSRPKNVTVSVLDPGYSTAEINGGLVPSAIGGALRTVLAYLANARYVAFLDDDNWWASNHLSSLCHAIQGHDWAYSSRWFVDPHNDQALCIDDWESAGLGKGMFAKDLGGWADPNTWLLDMKSCEPVLRNWCFPIPGDPTKRSADRLVFQALRQNLKGAATGQASCFYRMQESDLLHHRRLQEIAKRSGASREQEVNNPLATDS